MFVVDKKVKFIDRADKKLLAILQSSNQPLIAAADRASEPTEAFICSFQNKTKKIETLIMLHLVKSRIRVFYRTDKGEFLPNEFSEVEADALEFLESMGFTMDNIAFQKIKDAEKEVLFESLPLFSLPDDKKDVPPKQESDEYVSTKDLSSGLEEALSGVDFKEMEVDSKRESDESDLLKSFSREIDAEQKSPAAPSENTKSEPSFVDDLSLEDEVKEMPLGAGKIIDKSIEKIAKIFSSF